MVKLKTIYPYLLGTLISFFITISFYNKGWLDTINSTLHDLQVQTLSPYQTPLPAIKLIVIDQKSLEWMEKTNEIKWPWPRELYGVLNSFLSQADAKAVVYDMIYTEDSFYGISDDESFSNSLKELNSIGAMVLNNKSNPKELQDINLQRNTIEKKLCDGKSFSGTLTPIETINNGFKYLGAVNGYVDHDGVVREFKLGYLYQDSCLPTLPVQTYRMIEGKKNLDNTKKQYINYYNAPFSFESFSAASIIQSALQIGEGKTPEVPLETFKQAIVFIGVSASGLFDNKTSPLAKNHPGIDIQATILDNLLQNNMLHKPPNWAIIFTLLLSSIVTMLIVHYLKSFIKIVSSLSFVVLLIAVIAALNYNNHIILPLAPYLFVIVLTLIITGVLGYILEGRQKQFIKGAFGQYLSPHVVQQLIEDPNSLHLGGKTEELTIFFSDLQGFTSISENLEPQELVSILNDYLDKMSEIIFNYHGTIDKFEGDAIIAFWNAPIPNKDHGRLAVEAAIDYQKELRALQEYFFNKYNVNLYCRIGINTGEVVIGNIGSKKKFDYSFIGDAGNLASRVEGLNKFFATRILFTENTQKKVKDIIRSRRVGKVKVMGKKVPIDVFEPLDIIELDTKTLETFQKALELFESQKYQEAASLFESIADKDITSEKYLGIIEKIVSNKLVWDNGIIVDQK